MIKVSEKLKTGHALHIQQENVRPTIRFRKSISNYSDGMALSKVGTKVKNGTCG